MRIDIYEHVAVEIPHDRDNKCAQLAHEVARWIETARDNGVVITVENVPRDLRAPAMRDDYSLVTARRR